MENKNTQIQQPKNQQVKTTQHQSANNTQIKTSMERAGFIFKED
ncbi:MAG: hypothetical protein SPF22_08260 [Candidatus Onthovivens sp.]|nr:hypothetical protein [Candidatus Onthovivens sp.]